MNCPRIASEDIFPRFLRFFSGADFLQGRSQPFSSLCITFGGEVVEQPLIELLPNVSMRCLKMEIRHVPWKKSTSLHQLLSAPSQRQ